MSFEPDIITITSYWFIFSILLVPVKQLANVFRDGKWEWKTKKGLSPLPSLAYFNQNRTLRGKILDTSKSSTVTTSDKKSRAVRPPRCACSTTDQTLVWLHALAALRQQRSESGQGIRHLLRSRCLCRSDGKTNIWHLDKEQTATSMLWMLKWFIGHFWFQMSLACFDRYVHCCHWWISTIKFIRAHKAVIIITAVPFLMHPIQ